MARQANLGAPNPTSAEQIRNVVLVGPAGSGKTRILDHFVQAAIPGFRPKDRTDERSTDLEIASFEKDGVVVNLLAAPGAPDFVGELRAGLRAADAALFVVAANDGVDTATAALWRECADVKMPRAVLMTKLDAEHADFDSALEECQAAFGDGVQPLGIPAIGDDGQLHEIVDLVLGELYVYNDTERDVHPTSERHIPIYEQYQPPLMEGIIQEAEDDTLLDRYLEGEELGFDVVEGALLTAIARATFHPVVPVSVATGAGLDVAMHLVKAAFPPPTRARTPGVYSIKGAPEDPLTVDPKAPLVAEVIRTSADQYVGQVSVVRVFSGTLEPDTNVHVSGHLSAFTDQVAAGHEDHDEEVRMGNLSSFVGGELYTKPKAIAGDIAIVQKLPVAQTSDTLSDPANPVVVRPWTMPDALLPTAVEPASRADEDRLPVALQRLASTDPSLRIEQNVETGQTVLWATGPTHLDLVLERLNDEMGVEVNSVPLRIPLRETFKQASTAKGRHVKQSGGHGQYAICDITVEPLPRGEGFEFVDKVVGGAVPRQFIPSVEKGVRAQMEKGVVLGYPMVDIRVTLFDGKAHSVDSSDAAFQMAGSLALREAAKAEAIQLLEPVDTVTVTVAEEYLGAVMTDMSTRRGRILGTDSAEEEGFAVIRAEVPQQELTRYTIDLRSLSRGTGVFTREPLGYEEMPDYAAAELLKKDE